MMNDTHGLCVNVESLDLSCYMKTRMDNNTKVCVERPCCLRYGLSAEQLAGVKVDKEFAKLRDDREQFRRCAHSATGNRQRLAPRPQPTSGGLNELAGRAPFHDDAAFFAGLEARSDFRLTPGLKKMLRSTLGVRDANAGPALEEENRPVPDPEIRTLISTLRAIPAASRSNVRKSGRRYRRFLMS